VRVAYVAPHARPDDGWGRYTREVAWSVRTLGIEPVDREVMRAAVMRFRGRRAISDR